MKPNKVYRKVENVWRVVGFVCRHCNREIKSELIATKHVETCKHINRSNKEPTMPIQAVMKNGTRYYRYNDDGKLYTTMSEAEKARDNNSGYKKKKGADDKACWEGYRFAGTENGKDKCVKIKKD